jgi:DJ-1 family protein
MENTVIVPISTGSEELEVIAIVDILRRATIDVKLYGEMEIVTCSRGIKIIPDSLIHEIGNDEKFLGIVLPGGTLGVQNLSNNSTIINITRQLYKDNKMVAAICSATTILAEHKIIPLNTSITSHPNVMPTLANFNYFENAVIVDKNVITSRGAGTAVQFALTIVEYLKGQDMANKIAKDIVY